MLINNCGGSRFRYGYNDFIYTAYPYTPVQSSAAHAENLARQNQP